MILNPTADAYLTSNGGNYGTNESLIVGHLLGIGGASIDIRSIVRFSLATVTAPDVGQATLRLQVTGSFLIDGPFPFYVALLTQTGWVEAEATWTLYKTGSSWATAGGDKGPAVASENIGNATLEVAFDLTDEVLAGVGGNLDLIIYGEETPGYVRYVTFGAREAAADLRPTLEIVSPSVQATVGRVSVRPALSGWIRVAPGDR